MSQPHLPTYSVTAYGATGNGVTDDRVAIQATINAAAATGGIVYFPAGTYSVSIRGPLAGEDAWPRAFTIAPNVTFQGAGSGATIIRLANNQPAYGALLMPATYDQDVSGFSMFDLTLDSNALNNPLYSASDDAQTDFDLKRPRIAVQILTGSNTKIQRCVFTNVIGVWALNFYSYNVSNFLIDSNSFIDIGGGTLNFDSSTINFAGNGGTITNNRFYATNYNASNPYGLGMRTAIEVHNTNVTVANNQIYGFPVGIIMGGDSPTGASGLTVEDNVIQSAYNGIQIYPEMGNNSAVLAMQNCAIIGNTIVLDVNAWQPLDGVAGYYCNGISIIVSPDDGQIQNLLIQNNNITFTDYADGSARSINVDYFSSGIYLNRSTQTDDGPLNTNVQIIGNTVSNALGDGIYSQANQSSLVVSNNVIINPADSPFFADPSFWIGWQSAIGLDGPLNGAQVNDNQYIDNRPTVQTQAGLLWTTNNTGDCVYLNNSANVPLPLGLIFDGGGTGSWQGTQSGGTPLPVDLTVAAAPLGWKGILPDLITLIGQSIYGQLDPTFLIGQSGGTMPSHDIGPWFDDAGGANSGWFFFNPKTGSYSPLQQGLPVGGMVLWGGAGNIPANWLLCDGSEVSRATFSGLFTAIGETWGAGDGESTFNLPPGGVFFIAAAGFVADSRVPLATLTNPDGSTTTNGQGVGARGGSPDSALIRTSDLPPMMTTLRATFPNLHNFISAPGTAEVGFPNFQPQGYGSPDGFQSQPLADTSGNPIGSAQVPVTTLPPYCTINFIIKWQ